jgi:hypothetical protein
MSQSHRSISQDEEDSDVSTNLKNTQHTGCTASVCISPVQVGTTLGRFFGTVRAYDYWVMAGIVRLLKG